MANKPQLKIPIVNLKATLFQSLCDAQIVRGFDATDEIESQDKTRWIKLIEFLYPIVDALFPNTWDFEIARSYNTVHDEDDDKVDILKVGGALTLYYPHVVVLSKKGVEYPITDLYVRIHFNKEVNITGKIEGTRSSLRAIEYVGYYVHSHLQTSAREGFTIFCQGYTFMRDLLTKLSLNGLLDSDNNPIEDAAVLFEAFLHQLGAYVSHEASNGNPYRYIQNIGQGNNNMTVNDRECDVNYTRFKNYCKGFRYTPELVINNREIKIKQDDSSFERILLHCATRKQYRDALGQYYEDINSLKDIPDINPSFKQFIFRTQTITQKIIKHGPQEQQTSRQEYCHRTIKDHIITTLEAELNTRVIEEGKSQYYQRVQSARAERANRINSIKRSNDSKAHNKTKRLLEGLVTIVQNGQTGMVGSDVL